MTVHPSPAGAPERRVTGSVDGRVARVVHDGAARGNSFTTPALLDLVEELEGVAAVPSVAVVRLVMAGRHFCAGWDTSTFAGLAGATTEDVAADLAANDCLLGRIRSLPVPVVAAVRGRVAGFGAGLLAALHVPVASAGATLSLPEVGFGICPGGVLHSLLQRVPRPAAELMVLSGDVVAADDLLRWGLVARVVPEDELDDHVEALVARIAAHPGDVVRRIRGAVEETLAAGSPAPAYVAAARSITEGGGAA